MEKTFTCKCGSDKFRTVLSTAEIAPEDAKAGKRSRWQVCAKCDATIKRLD